MNKEKREFLLKSLKTIGSILFISSPFSLSLTSCDDKKSEDNGENNNGESDQDASTGISASGDSLLIDTTNSKTETLKNIGGVLSLSASETENLSENGLFIIRKSESEVTVLDRTCTHLGCTVGDFADGIATCPCHGSKFDAEGGVVNGPAAKALTEYTATLNEDIITITFN